MAGTTLGRRELLVGAAALATTAAAGAQAAHHGHSGSGGHASGDAKLAAAALDCVATGDACISHCLAEFKQGRTELAECAARVEELIVTCRALALLAAHGSSHTKAFAAVTAEVCRTCEEECRKHEKHSQCLDCAKACARCIEACERVESA